ncbi:hypothetical protein C2G38_2204752 [Gigaspora rosea]|uniref:Uncharacterized protein n=1 Tax=Gigaspora rosea TaxID=44941 RepID=A0A397UL32_9GLOM|nr:hypothetical protein C2G38_2204752 [Gigaspora rosea]CAG8656680.1 23831_t:CDS:2 [Gigaspora rosea]
MTTYRKKPISNKNLSIVEALDVILTGFYLHDAAKELSLLEFEDKSVILATGNFHIIEDIDQNNKRKPVLKITLNNVVRFNTLNPDDLSAFPVLINIMVLGIDHEDILSMFELIITKDDNIVHIYSISFSEYQKLNTILKSSPTQLLWESENQPEQDPQNTAAQTITTKVKASIRRKKTVPASKLYFNTGSRLKVTDLANNTLMKLQQPIQAHLIKPVINE